jgi:ribosome production factor 2
MMAMRRAKEPVERTAKRVMLLKGTSSSETMNAVLQDLSLISKPNHKTMTRKNDILPFEDVNSLEFLGQKNDCSLFAFVSHTKKRPHNLVLVSQTAGVSIVQVCNVLFRVLLSVDMRLRLVCCSIVPLFHCSTVPQGRLFDGHLLDMFEFGVDPETKKSLEDFSGEKKGLGSKPLLLFNGDQWANEPTYKAIQNLFIDFFRVGGVLKPTSIYYNVY